MRSRPSVAELGAEGDEQLARPLGLAEAAGDVDGRLELDRPGLVALRALPREGGGRAVVGDGGGEERDVDVCERECGVEHRLGGRGRDRLDAVRRGNGEVRGEQHHLGPAAPRLLGQRDAHAAGGAVADEPGRVEGLAGAAGRDEHALAAEAAGREECLGAVRDLGGLGHPPDPPLTLGGLAFVGADELGAAGDAASRRWHASPGGTTSAGSSRERSAPARGARAQPR